MTPRYVPFEIAPGLIFALWSGRAEPLTPDLPRTCELGLMLPGAQSAVDDRYAEWSAKGSRWWRSPMTTCSAELSLSLTPTETSSASRPLTNGAIGSGGQSRSSPNQQPPSY